MDTTVLNTLFSRTMLRSCIAHEPSKKYLFAAHTLLNNKPTGTNGQAICELYKLLASTHCNEYVFKNTLFNRIVLGRHSLRTSTAFTEVPIQSSIADFLIINKEATVYEIKTDLDNLNRLDVQLKNYQCAFDRVCIVCGSRHLPTLMQRYADSPIGIATMTRYQHLSMRKEPQSYSACLRHDTIFKLLRKKEYGIVLSRCGVTVPNTFATFHYYRDCLTEFRHIPMPVAYASVLRALRQRGEGIEATTLKTVPFELRTLGYFIRINQKQSQRLAAFLCAPLSPLEVNE